MSTASLPYPRLSMATCCFIKPQKGHCLDIVFEPSLFASLLSWSFVDYRVGFWKPWVRWMSSPAHHPSLTCFGLNVRFIKHYYWFAKSFWIRNLVNIQFHFLLWSLFPVVSLSNLPLFCNCGDVLHQPLCTSHIPESWTLSWRRWRNRSWCHKSSQWKGNSDRRLAANRCAALLSRRRSMPF